MVTARGAARVHRYLLWGSLLVLPLLLVISAWLTLREFGRAPAVYLRGQAAALVARLEALSPDGFQAQLEKLVSEEPALVDIRVFEVGDDSVENRQLEPLWRGQELFRLEERREDGLFRAYIPFHSGNQLRIARIDLAGDAADHLLRHARHNMVIALASAAALVALSLYALYSLRRAAALERRQLELQHLAHLGQMAAVLAHEIRNPLGSMKGFAQLALEKAGPELQPYLSPIPDEARRLEKLVEDLLLYSRTPQPSVRRIEWTGFAAELEGEMRSTASVSGVGFTWRPAALQFDTDPHLLKHILLNLIQNAVQAMEARPASEVRLEIAGGNDRVSITVADNGPGIDPAVAPRLFEPFFTTKPAGTGLGLPIARKLAEALGGELRVRNRAPHGTVAELVLPVRPDAKRASEEAT